MKAKGSALKSFALIVFVLTLSGATAVATAGEGKDILGTVQTTDDFKTFTKALKAAGLDEVLKGKGPITVFAPTDEAFAGMVNGSLEDLLKPENKARLKKVLSYHMAKGKLMERHLAYMDWATTLNGKKVIIKHKKGDILLAKKANVVKSDIPCSNGVIHVIDKVLMP